MNNLKVIALYLPQFHQIPENDEFWGEGFTDWELVKKAEPLFSGHQQPNIPLNNNYYDLSKKEDVEWQCKLAADHGIYGFGVYHYWFNDEKNLLTKPAEIMRDSQNIKTKYFFIWDNSSWRRSWSNAPGFDWSPIMDNKVKAKNTTSVLLEYKLGDKVNWFKHYEYVKNHFKSQNYEKLDNKPLFGIINYNENINQMCEFWNELAIKDGFDGIFFIFKYKHYLDVPKNLKYHYYFYNYEPHFSGWGKMNLAERIKRRILRNLKLNNRLHRYNYNKVWNSIIKNAKLLGSENIINCGFVGFDDTPRRGKKNSNVISGKSLDLFEKYLNQLLILSKQQNKKYLFLTAWNEWSEGAYLEPDEMDGSKYLDSIKKIIKFD